MMYRIVGKLKNGGQTIGFVLKGDQDPEGMTRNVSYEQVVAAVERGEIQDCKIQTYKNRKIIRGNSKVSLKDLPSYQFTPAAKPAIATPPITATESRVEHEAPAGAKKNKVSANRKKTEPSDYTRTLCDRFKRVSVGVQTGLCSTIADKFVEKLNSELKKARIPENILSIKQKCVRNLIEGSEPGDKDYMHIIIVRDNTTKNISAAAIEFLSSCAYFLSVDTVQAKRLAQQKGENGKSAQRVVDFMANNDSGDEYIRGDGASARDNIVDKYSNVLLDHFNCDLGLGLKNISGSSGDII